MNKEKVLILVEPKADIYYDDWLRCGYKAARQFKPVNKFLRAIRRVWMNRNLPFYEIWFNDWIKTIGTYDAIILHMNKLTLHLPENLAKKYPNLLIKCFYWNTIDEDNKPIKTNNPNIEYFSFDDNDCKKYNLKYNIEYYCPQIVDNSHKESDIYFLGLPKGREEEVYGFKEIAVKQGLKCNFRIIETINDFIPYKENQKEVTKTKAILDIVKKNQVGLTSRVLESLFFEVKLITNNPFVRQTKIYNKNNVFILGEDDYDNLYEFVTSPYDTSVNKYKNEYDVDTWFNTFFK